MTLSTLRGGSFYTSVAGFGVRRFSRSVTTRTGTLVVSGDVTRVPLIGLHGVFSMVPITSTQEPFPEEGAKDSCTTVVSHYLYVTPRVSE